MYTLLCDPHRGEKYQFFQKYPFSSFVFFSPSFYLFIFLREKALCLLFLLFSLSLFLSLSFGWTDVRGKGKHLNTLAQWWTQAKRADVHWELNTEPPNNNTPSLILLLTHSLTHTHTHTFSKLQCKHTHSPARRIQRPIKTVFKIKAHK